jgi:acyl carrier protein
MEPTPENETPEEAVRTIVAEALARDPASVRLESRLMDDLGAESLDFLDIVFKLERRFGIQITRGEMEGAARGDMSEEEFAPGGVISEAGLARLRELMPESADRIRPGLRPALILSLFTVRTFANMVRAKTAETTAGKAVVPSAGGTRSEVA